jgi:hypothetical protein
VKASPRIKDQVSSFFVIVIKAIVSKKLLVEILLPDQKAHPLLKPPTPSTIHPFSCILDTKLRMKCNFKEALKSRTKRIPHNLRIQPKTRSIPITHLLNEHLLGPITLHPS